MFAPIDPLTNPTDGWTRIYLPPTWRTLCDAMVAFVNEAAELATATIITEEDQEEEEEEEGEQ